MLHTFKSLYVFHSLFNQERQLQWWVPNSANKMGCAGGDLHVDGFAKDDHRVAKANEGLKAFAMHCPGQSAKVQYVHAMTFGGSITELRTPRPQIRFMWSHTTHSMDDVCDLT